MLEHLNQHPDETPIRIECDIQNGYAVNATLGDLRNIQELLYPQPKINKQIHVGQLVYVPQHQAIGRVKGISENQCLIDFHSEQTLKFPVASLKEIWFPKSEIRIIR